MKILSLFCLFLNVLAHAETPAAATAQPAQATQAAPAATASTASSTTVTTPENTTVEKWKFGITGGVNLSNFGRDLTGTTSRMGFMGGLYFQYKVTEKLYIAPSITYLQKGYSDSQFTVTVDYIEVPLQLIYKVGLNQTESAKLRIFAGPQFGYLMTKNQTGSGATSTDPGLKTLDFSAQGGLGVEFAFGSTVVFLDGRYQFGLANINDTNSLSTRNATAAYSTSGIMGNIGAYWSF